MRSWGLACIALMLAACTKDENVACCAKPQPDAVVERQVAEAGAPGTTHVIPPQSSADVPGYKPMDMSPTDSMPACRAGLKAKGLNDAELEIMLGPMAGVCPNTGVTEGRIREILTTIWTQAGCTQHGPIEVAKALDSGACGGDAG